MHTHVRMCVSVVLMYECVMYVQVCGCWHLWTHAELRGEHWMPCAATPYLVP